MEFGAAHKRRRDEHERDVTIAWYTAAFERQRKLPDLRTVLGTQVKQSPEQMKTMLGIMADAYGMKLRRIEH